MQRALLVMKMDPAHASDVAQAFADHDRTDLPVEIGAVSRTLFSYHGLYFHLVEAPGDLDGALMDRIYAASSHPVFAETAQRLKPFLTPYAPNWRSLYDSRADEIYRWDAKVGTS